LLFDIYNLEFLTPLKYKLTHINNMTPYEIISKKRDNLELSPEEISFFINNYTTGEIPDYQMSALLMAIYLQGMTIPETTVLTQTMLNSGEIVDLSDIPGIKVDKHSTGGVGDKVSIILAPIVAAAGVPVPMISGRGLGHSGGTLDKLESIPGFRVDYSIDEYKKKIEKIGVCLIGQTTTLVPADKKIYALRDVTATIQSIPLICASIMSKKLAEGIDALVLDVKCGNGAFMRELSQAENLAKSLIKIGEDSGKPTVAFITNMNNPLGNSVGNWCEIIECIDCLKGKGPSDLMEITHELCGAMIYLGGKADSMDEGMLISKRMILEGLAWNKFCEIVAEQEGNIDFIVNPDKYETSEFTHTLFAKTEGWIKSIDALEVGLSAIKLGAGRIKSTDNIDPKAGILFHKKPGDFVKINDEILTCYTDKNEILDEVSNALQRAIIINHAKSESPEMVLKFLTKDD
jgi:pyrimidine-nucleoside phosphorylase